MENIKTNLAKNLIRLRKASNLTQAELANKLSYSDKAISKWERGESVPDIEILYDIAKLYGVTIDDLLTSSEVKPQPTKSIKTKQHIIIALLSVILVWFIATCIYVALVWSQKDLERVWMVFIYAIPLSAILCMIFSSIWGKRIITSLFTSILIWTIAVACYLSVLDFQYGYLIFIIAIPVQLGVLFWYALKFLREREMNLSQFIENSFKKRKSKKEKIQEEDNKPNM